MRVAVAMLFCSLLVGCGEEGLQPLPVMHVEAGFPKLGLADVIVVDAVDRLALTSATLVDPDGKAAPASDIEVKDRPSMGSQRLLGSAAYTGEVFAPATSFTPNTGSPSFLGGAPQASSRLLAVISTASLPVPDPVGYARDWQRYRIRLTFGRPPGEVEEREIAAPPPPRR